MGAVDAGVTVRRRLSRGVEMACLHLYPTLYFYLSIYPFFVGCVYIWDQRQDTEPVMSLVPAEGLEKKPDCWSVAFGLNLAFTFLTSFPVLRTFIRRF
jgi:hypothetical protein